MEAMRLYNEPTEATLDQTIALNSVIPPRTRGDAGVLLRATPASTGRASIGSVHAADEFVPI